MEFLIWMIVIAGLIIIPWYNDLQMERLRQEAEDYEEEHKAELYGTSIMHVNNKGDVDTKDWEN